MFTLHTYYSKDNRKYLYLGFLKELEIERKYRDVLELEYIVNQAQPEAKLLRIVEEYFDRPGLVYRVDLVQFAFEKLKVIQTIENLESEVRIGLCLFDCLFNRPDFIPSNLIQVWKVII